MGGGVYEFSFGNTGVPFIHSFAFCGFKLPTGNLGCPLCKQMILLTNSQKVSSSLMLGHSAYVIHSLLLCTWALSHLESSEE